MKSTMSSNVKRLEVLWKDEYDRRQLIGQLDRIDDGFEFRYLDGAKNFAFRGLPEFPLVKEEKVFKRERLFATFSSRLPSPVRPDFEQMLKSWGVINKDDQLEILAKSGGFSATDSMEFYEFRNDLKKPLEFRIEGMIYKKEPTDFKIGEVLTLERDDEFGTFVTVRGDIKLGYVPNSYSELLSKHLPSSLLHCELTRKIEVPQDRPSWVAVVEARPM